MKFLSGEIATLLRVVALVVVVLLIITWARAQEVIVVPVPQAAPVKLHLIELSKEDALAFLDLQFRITLMEADLKELYRLRQTEVVRLRTIYKVEGEYDLDVKAGRFKLKQQPEKSK